MQSPISIQQALDDFRQARQSAVIEEILGRFTGKETQLLPYDEVRQTLRIQGSLMRGVQDIPLDAIVGSVNRYEEFTRSFLPRKSVSPQRWARIEVAANGMAGLPPIEVYQIGEIYFVIDGNHRVSVARRSGATRIQAYVYEVPSRVPLEPGDNLEAVLLKAEYASFLVETQIDKLRPGADLLLTTPGQFVKLLEHIKVHQYYMGIDFQRDVSFEEAVGHWYDKVYMPVIEIIRNQGLQREFPERTEADLYLWIAEHRAELESQLEKPINPLSAATHLAEELSPGVERRAQRIAGKILDTLVPDSLEPGPDPGIWREEKVILNQESCLFSDILVPVNGQESGWFALDQAVLVAQKENARLNGLYITSAMQMNSPDALRVQEEFNERCKRKGVPGQLALAKGPVARGIVERSRWNDLVILNLNFPPSPHRLAKFSSGFRELVLRCPRPILAVPRKISDLSKPLLAYDGSPKANEALYVATYLAGKWKLPITVVGVKESDQDIQSVLNNAGQYLEEHGITPNLIIKTGQIADAILQTAEEENCDWIIMGGYGEPPLVNLLLDNVLDRVLRGSQKPVLLCR